MCRATQTHIFTPRARYAGEEAKAEGWEAAVLKLEERLKMARTDMAAGRAPTRSPET